MGKKNLEHHFRIHRLKVGILPCDQGLMTNYYKYGANVPDHPVQFFYIEGPDERIIVDTGGPAQLNEKFHPGGKDVRTFEEALDSVHLKPEDIDIIIASHLMYDHMLNAQKCPNARVYVQEEELRFAYSPHPVLAMTYSTSYLTGLKFVPIHGDTEIVPGVRVVYAPGHTPGTQAVAVETKDGLAVMTGFCCNEANFTQCPDALKDTWSDIIPIGIHIDAAKAWESQLRVKGLADIIIPQHGREIPDVIG